MNQDKNKDRFELTDLHLASYLRAKHNLPIIDIARDGKRAIFIFSTGGVNVKEAIKDYYNGDVVKATDFVREMGHLKSIIYNY